MEKYFTIQTDTYGDEYWYIQGQDGNWYRGFIMKGESYGSDNAVFWFCFDLVPGIGH